ncbi:hypothetical protein LI90_1808 [Carbonactinospora thermoautotrophica]|uniref:Uncharacterized protein n=1 Tax=Carbonactinospora thermoautotrophica TaxID=1469144 RepID=A0A132MSC8_9ACTN|nr:hypothetical protein LI90_1808 [Carbonactinospora thermoautotrophica]
MRWTIRLLRGVDSFLDDWRGTEARPGVPARPGVLARLGALELRVDEIAGRLGDVERELRLNGGTSLRDAVHRIEQRLG